MQGAFAGTRGSFALAYVVLGVAVLGLIAVASRSPHARPTSAGPRQSTWIPATAWGRATNYDGAIIVTLGPAGDRRRKYEHGFARLEFDSVGILVSSDRGRTFFRLAGEPMGRCGFHWQGYGMNVIVARQACVPVWATGRGGVRAREWVRIENLVPYARIVLVKYPARPAASSPSA